MNNISQNLSISQNEQESNAILEELKQKQIDLEQILIKKASEREGMIEDIAILEKRLSDLSKSILKKRELQKNYAENIETSEKALIKISESTKTLLDFVCKKNQLLDRESNY